MFKTIRNAWAIPDLRKKILFTLFVIIIFRIGSAVPVPFLNMAALAEVVSPIKDDPTNLINYLSIISGGAFENATIFAMSVTPYINSSIIMQLLCVAIPALERLSKEGEEGRKKIAQITRYVTIVLGLIQGFAFYMFLRNSVTDTGSRVLESYGAGWDVYIAFVIIFTFTAGTALMMWLGEQINQKGIGNGISVLLFAGIVSRGPDLVTRIVGYIQMGMAGEYKYYVYAPLYIIMMVLTFAFIVFMNNAERRIPVQYAKRVVGRKMYGGQSTHIPIKVNMSGVMPIIFASSIMSIPATIKMFVYGNSAADTVGYKILNILSGNDWGIWIYAVLYFVLIIAFAYFYVTIQYNPIEMANNLRKNSGTIPGIRPGKSTSEYIQKILSRITLIGALFLSVIAILPILIGAIINENIGMSGTSLIILVGVALETVQQIESQMLMRHYKGFLE